MRYANRRKHYPVDQGKLAQTLKRDPKRELESAKNRGFYTYQELLILPLKDIQPERIWRPDRLLRVEEAILKGRALPPITVSENRGSFTIEDGIHRYNASLDAGFTHIPALITRLVETPELKELTPAYKVGQYVQFKERQEGRWQIGYLAEKVHGDIFVVIAGDATDADWLGDLHARLFQRVIEPPLSIKKQIQQHWYLAQ